MTHPPAPPRDARWAAEWVLPVLAPPIRAGAVAVEAGRIVAVGGRDAVARTHAHLPESDLGGAVLAPGLIDAHCHLEWALLGGLLPSAPFHGWLAAMIAHRGRTRSDGALDVAARLGALRCLQHGTTTVADSGPTGAGVPAAAELGLRAHVLLEVVGRDRGADAVRRADEVADALDALRQLAGPLVRVGTAPHAIYSVGPELWEALLAHDTLRGGPWGCHLAESPAERELVASGGGALALVFASAGFEPALWPGPPGDTPVVRADRAGVLRDGLLAAHCVQLDAGDAALLGERGVRPVLCPTSNAHLVCGVAPLGAFRRVGIRPALGTDSPASAGPFDLRAEARMLAATQGLAGDPLTPDELLRMATMDGAGALDRDDIGALAVGRRADLTAVVPPLESEGPPAAGFLHPFGRVVAVAVDGEARIWDGRLLGADAEAITTAAADARRRLC